MLGIAADLDEDGAVLAESLSDSNLKGLIGLGLKKARRRSARDAYSAVERLTWQRKHSWMVDSELEHPRP
jgi:hypothetical protein